MAKTTTTKSKKAEKEIKPKVKCTQCNRDLSDINFYNTSSPMFPSGKVSICKKCLKEMINYNDINTIYNILMAMDLPFVQDLWKRCEEKGGDTFGNYIRQVNSLPQYSSMRWVNSAFDDKNTQIDNGVVTNRPLIDSREKERLIDKWGFGYNDQELYMFEKKYKKLIDSYGEKTALHTENLLIYIRFRVKEEMATAQGDAQSASKWGALAENASKNAKITVQQLSKSDISGGVDLLPQLFEAVEDKVGIIPTLPKLKEQPYDDADLIIWAIINYMQRLEDKPRIAYKDIWNFYDDMLVDFYSQKGFNESQINQERVKRNAIFRDLSEVYKEPIYEDGDI